MEQLVCLGGFRNVRSDFDWAGAKLELDETQYEWGTVYEIEVESVCARQTMPAGCAVPLWHAWQDRGQVQEWQCVVACTSPHEMVHFGIANAAMVLEALVS